MHFALAGSQNKIFLVYKIGVTRKSKVLPMAGGKKKSLKMKSYLVVFKIMPFRLYGCDILKVKKVQAKHQHDCYYIMLDSMKNNSRTFCIRSRAPPVTKVSFPLSSTVTALSFSKVMPAAKGWPGLLENRKCKVPTQIKESK